MAETQPPLIPAWLAHRPVVGGVVVPWITPRTTDGRYLLGTIEQTLADRALRQRLCGVCGRQLGDRQVLLMRLSDLPRQHTNEPGLDPVCAHYTTSACPMISGRLTTYRSNPIHIDDSDSVDRVTSSTSSAARQGAPAEPWFAVWLRTYQLITDHGHLTASYTDITPMRIRPITWRFLELW